MGTTGDAVGLLLALLVLLCVPVGVGGQLISPGRLSAAHADIEGIRNCTQCHQLRKQGISADLCLSCHTPLARRLEAQTGFHASVGSQGCADCHKEHLGREFEMVRLDTLSFEHDQTGYVLEGEHATTSCRSCHVATLVSAADVRAFKGEHGSLDKTFLGLDNRCATCHDDDTPHADQFRGQACSDCHDPLGWEDARVFDHAETAFPLTGRHTAVTCGDCHAAEAGTGGGDPVVRYQGIANGRCNDCHEDEHDGSMPGRCQGCHTTDGWQNLNLSRLGATFDHRGTGFPLEGRHASAPCASCHDAAAASTLKGIHLEFAPSAAGRAFPKPMGEGCIGCHEDEHGEAMADDCQSCHTPSNWNGVDRRRLEAAFDHASTGFQLVGRHAEAPCASCHDPNAFRALEGVHIVLDGTADGPFPAPTGDLGGCLACHQDRHDGAFEGGASGTDCLGCHRQTGWLPTEYDLTRHNRDAGFALEGAHAVVACNDCHTPIDGMPDFSAGGGVCAACHQSVDPHGDQFTARSCADCHGTDAFRITQFDHDTTRFPLDGAHEGASCGACHVAEPDPSSGTDRVRYRPLGITCRDCHGGLS